jgi:hypothetical protein
MQPVEQAGALAAATEAALKVLPETMRLVAQGVALAVGVKAVAAALKARREMMLLVAQVAESEVGVKEVHQRQTAIREI